MTSPIRTERDENVLVIISDNPPVNALGQAVRAGLVDSIDKALSDDTVEAVVIRCDGRTFFAGADITEFGKPPQGRVEVGAAQGGKDRRVERLHGNGLPQQQRQLMLTAQILQRLKNTKVFGRGQRGVLAGEQIGG